MPLVLPLLGLVAGVLSTVAGQGGGLFLILVCSAFVGPHVALAITAPALLLGNLHRAILYRRSIDRPIAARMVAGALPAAFVGGLLADAIPALVLHVLLVALTGVAIARALGYLRFAVPGWALTPAAAGIGALTGTSGGAGILFAPLLLCAGLTGASYAGTLALVAVAAHTARVVAYGSNGLITADLAWPTVALAASILAGNALGTRARARLSDRATTRLEYGVLVVCVGVSLATMA
ncbi:MAG: sulfite exporter TauE/SafE family protein [Labilithrix sp.]|nr:sulfite exporter TauE/SafE family protein [Labilithrix sp.]